MNNGALVVAGLFALFAAVFYYGTGADKMPLDKSTPCAIATYNAYLHYGPPTPEQKAAVDRECAEWEKDRAGSGIFFAAFFLFISAKFFYDGITASE